MANPSQNSIDYYREREQHEIRLAHNATSQAIRSIHLEMAESYREMVEKLEEAYGTHPPASNSAADPPAAIGL